MFSQPPSIFRFIFSRRPLNILNQFKSQTRMFLGRVLAGRQGIKDNFNFDQDVSDKRHGRIVVEASTFPWVSTFLKESSLSNLQSPQGLQFLSLQYLPGYLPGLFLSVFVFSTPAWTQHMKPNFCKVQGITKVKSRN